MQPTSKSNTSLKPQRFYYGWVILAACLVVVVISSGIRFSFGVFFKPLSNDFNISRTVTSEIFSVYMALSSLSMIFAGFALDKYKPRSIFAAMGFFTGLSLLLTTQASELWHIYISYSLLLAIGTGSVYTIALSLALRWFVENRGLAVGIVASGMGIGIMLMTPLSAWLIADYGWQMSYFILALVAFLLMIPCSLLLKRAPNHTATLSDSGDMDGSKSSAIEKLTYGKNGDFSLHQAAKTGNFWLIVIIKFLLASCVYIVLTHVVPHAIDLGIDPLQASSILSLIGGTSVVGMLLMGRASDSIGRIQTIIICALLMTGAMLWLILVSGLWMLYLFAIIFGFSQGGIAPPINALIGDTFGMRHIGLIMGVLNTPWGIGAAMSPVIAGYIFDTSGSYSYAFLTGLAAALITGILTLVFKSAEQ